MLDRPQVRKGATTVVSSCISHTKDVFSPSRPHFRRATSSVSFALPSPLQSKFERPLVPYSAWSLSVVPRCDRLQKSL